MKQGFSGYCVHKEGCFVIKWTKGKEAVSGLRIDTHKHIHQIEFNQMDPFIPVKINSVIDEPDFYSVKMPFVDEKTVYELGSEPEGLFKTFTDSINNRLKQKEPYFKKVALKQLSLLVQKLKKNPNPEHALFLTYRIETLIKKCDDIYPSGFCHGDLGLANIFYTNNKFYLIDFHDSFIYSPLMDIAALNMCVEQADVKIKWHKEFLNKINKEFHQYKDQIEILKKLRYFEFLVNANGSERYRYINLLND